MIEKHGPDFPAKLCEELSICTEATKFCLKNAVGDVRKFVADVKSKKKLASVVAASNSALDPFTSIMGPFNATADSLATQLQEQGEHTQRAYLDLLRVRDV